MAQNPRVSRWCFTINNHTQTHINAVTTLINGPGALLGLAAIEISTNGTPHIQGFVHLTRQIYRNQINALVGGGAHCEVCRGTDEQNLLYCAKDGQVFALKVPHSAPNPPGFDPRPPPPPPPSLADIVHAAQTLSVEQFVQQYPEAWLHHRTELERIMLAAAIQRASVWPGDLHAKNVWIWGPAGIGKSLWAYQQSPYGSTMQKSRDQWWEGYSLAITNGVIVENYPQSPTGSRLAPDLLQWADRTPFVGALKGSSVLVEPGRFTLIVTSHYSIDQCFRGDEERDALRDRFVEIHITEENREEVMQLRLDRSILTQ